MDKHLYNASYYSYPFRPTREAEERYIYFNHSYLLTHDASHERKIKKWPKR
jgi:hypothetical protein